MGCFWAGPGVAPGREVGEIASSPGAAVTGVVRLRAGAVVLGLRKGAFKLVARENRGFACGEVAWQLDVGVTSSREREDVAAHGRKDSFHLVVRATVEANPRVADGLVGSGEGGMAIAGVHRVPTYDVGRCAVLEEVGGLGARRWAGEGDLVGPLNLVLWVGQLVHQGAVGGPQQQARAVEIETPHRPEFRAEGVVVELLQIGAVLWKIALRIQFCQQ